MLECKTQCYLKTYGYYANKINNGQEQREYTYYVERGCREKTTPDVNLYSTVHAKSNRYGIKVLSYRPSYLNISIIFKATIESCNYQNGTLCNNVNIDNFIGTARFRIQQEDTLKCKICDSTKTNT